MSAYTRVPSMALDSTNFTLAPNRRGIVAGSPAPIIDWTPSQAARSWCKRALDMGAASVGLLILAPAFLALAAAIRFDSRGPILFRQARMGLGGRTFTCFKLRTMVPDAEARLKDLEAHNESAGGVLFKIKSDPRITPLGRFLRRSSLDELPQLWNVLRGDMSLVGPRPLQLRDCERLARVEPAAYAQRLSVLPGITGPWQVGGRSEVDSARMLRLDLDYVNDWSIGADLRILGKTVGVVLTGKGAS